MNRLGWMHAPEHSLAQWDRYTALANAVRADGLDRTLVCGMGGSSLAPHVLASSASRPRAPLHVLDSTDPAAVLAAERAHDPARTLYLIVSKSGTTVETLAFYRHFATRARPTQFVAITDPGSPLEQLARERGFRAVIEHPADVGGRYAALTAVGMLPAALLGLDGRTLLQRAAAVDPERAKALGRGLAVGVHAGRDKLVLQPPASVAALASWIEQLVAESSGKDGRGVVPVVDDPLGVVLPDVQTVTDVSGDPLDLGAEFLRWEYATWELCEGLGVNAFDQPDVDDAKRLAREELEQAGGGGAGAQHAAPLPTLSPDELRARARPGDYLAILAYLAPHAEVTARLQAVRAEWGRALRCATTLGFGPRYLHSTGQLHKGGPNTGLFLVITADDAQDLEIPGGGGAGTDVRGAQAGAGAGGHPRVARARAARGARAPLPLGGRGEADAVTGLIFHLIAHTHWDREWYLPRAAFQARFVPMLDDLIERLQADAGFRSFLLDGQTVLLEDYLHVRPDREADIKALVKTGRLQVGPWYVLADEIIPSGESLLRNLLLGAADADRLGGRLDVLYSPDAFGHPAVWPALAREFGIKHGVVWRGLGGEPGQERDLYRWRAPDGRDVLVWHLPPGGYEIGAALPADPDRLPAAWHRVRSALVDRAAGKHIPVFVGADHHAAHPQLVRLRDLLLELEPANAFRISRLDEFFQAAAEAGSAAAAPLAAGEQRWSYRYTWTLQGVHGTRAPLKRRHGEAELWLERVAEPLASLARRYGGRDRRPLLELAWRTLVRAQFHDTIAGCTIDAVAAAAERRVADVRAYAQEIARGALHELVGHDPDTARERGAIEPALVLWNPGARPRAGVVVADVTVFRRDVLVGPRSSAGDPEPRSARGYEPFAFRTRDGRTLPVQVLARRTTNERLEAARHYPDEDEVDQVRVAFRAPAVPGLGLGTLTLGPVAPLPRGEGVQVRGRTLENRFVEVALESTGALTLVDRRAGERYAGLLRLEDAGDAGDAYTYCPPHRDRVTRSRGPIAVRRLAAGPLVAALEARWQVVRDVTARLVVQLYADSPLVRCSLEIDNRATQHRLRARLPLGSRFAEVVPVAGAAFGAAARPAVSADRADYPLETPVQTAPAHRFVAAARGARGLALLAPAFFEYEWTPDGDVIVTLLRCVGDLSRADLPTRRGHAAWPTRTPDAQCLGRSRIEFALAPVSAADLERGDAVPHLWEDAFLPTQGWWLRDAGALAPAPTDVALEGTGLVLSAVKPAQAGSPMVLRCYNATGRKAAGAWRFGDGVKNAHRVRADERESVALVLEQRGHVVRFVAEPHEIVTILVT